MNLCFDECMPPKWFRVFAKMLGEKKVPVAACHLLDHFPQGKKDSEVVDWLASHDPPMIVISGDSGRGSGRSPRLPVLCPQQKVTSIIVAPKLCQLDGFEKLRMMMICLPEIEEIYRSGQRGIRHRLRRRPNSTLYEVVPWPLATL